METLLFEKEIMFHVKTDEEVFEKQFLIIKSLEVLGLKYQIKRTSQYGTGTPTWKLSVYK
jgi:hypothetical protein